MWHIVFTMIISSWNINSVRIRTENIEKYLDKIDPDIIMFQEIKCEDDKFPYEFFEKGAGRLPVATLKGGPSGAPEMPGARADQRQQETGLSAR